MIFSPKLQISTIKLELPSNVTLVAVSKTRPIEDILDAYSGGQRIFGENRPLELASKYDVLPKDIQWHMIGNLQTNKLKYIVPFVAMIHSVNSERLLSAIDEAAAKCCREINILLEIQIATEESKHGWNSADLLRYLSGGQWRAFKNVRFCGVMGMSTNTDDAQQVKDEFTTLKQLYDSIKNTYFQNDDCFKEISMGMSGDYKIAIECGSTMIRIGSTIFKH